MNSLVVETALGPRETGRVTISIPAKGKRQKKKNPTYLPGYRNKKVFVVIVHLIL